MLKNDLPMRGRNNSVTFCVSLTFISCNVFCEFISPEGIRSNRSCGLMAGRDSWSLLFYLRDIKLEDYKREVVLQTSDINHQMIWTFDLSCTETIRESRSFDRHNCFIPNETTTSPIALYGFSITQKARIKQSEQTLTAYIFPESDNLPTVQNDLGHLPLIYDEESATCELPGYTRDTVQLSTTHNTTVCGHAGSGVLTFCVNNLLTPHLLAISDLRGHQLNASQHRCVTSEMDLAPGRTGLQLFYQENRGCRRTNTYHLNIETAGIPRYGISQVTSGLAPLLSHQTVHVPEAHFTKKRMLTLCFDDLMEPITVTLNSDVIDKGHGGCFYHPIILADRTINIKYSEKSSICRRSLEFSIRIQYSTTNKPVGLEATNPAKKTKEGPERSETWKYVLFTVLGLGLLAAVVFLVYLLYKSVKCKDDGTELQMRLRLFPGVHVEDKRKFEKFKGKYARKMPSITESTEISSHTEKSKVRKISMSESVHTEATSTSMYSSTHWIPSVFESYLM